ncbi:MAG: glycosyltransferase family 2 protein [Bacteroidaceae bacterium]|nr:glycosyltransferase family 2 protein [Bacteroidaceae bacterium]
MDFINALFGNDSGLQLFNLIDAIIFLFVAIAVLYLFIFALKSLGDKITKYPSTDQFYSYAVIIPAYNEDSVILNSVKSFKKQNYPTEKYDIFVATRHMSDETVSALTQEGVTVIPILEPKTSKTRALQLANEYIEQNQLKYDIAVILDANNLVDPIFLKKINDAFYAGCSAVQTHRVAKNATSSIAILDAVSEEINNSIFRKGHTQLGLSSSLIGSGMAFDYDLFNKCIREIKMGGFDKQMEVLLLKSNIYIEYLSDVYTYDEKVNKSSQFYSQRKRWVSSQFSSFYFGLLSLPRAILSGNVDYCNKLIQWAMPPRVILLGLSLLFAVLLTLLDVSNSFATILSIKWWCLFILLLLTFSMAVPDYLINSKLVKATIKIPLLFLMMFANLFRVFSKNNREDEKK